MPRAHTPQERERICQRLLDTGCEAFARAGLGKVSIAELAERAGIGKGSFYKFFDSKEALFLAVQEREEAAFKESLVAELSRAESGRQRVVSLLLAAAERLVHHPFLRLLLDPKTLGELMVRIEPERMEAHRDDDRRFFMGLVDDWKQRGWLRAQVEAKTVFEVLAAMFVLSAQAELIGEEATQGALREMAEALADRWCA